MKYNYLIFTTIVIFSAAFSQEYLASQDSREDITLSKKVEEMQIIADDLKKEINYLNQTIPRKFENNPLKLYNFYDMKSNLDEAHIFIIDMIILKRIENLSEEKTVLFYLSKVYEIKYDLFNDLIQIINQHISIIDDNYLTNSMNTFNLLLVKSRTLFYSLKSNAKYLTVKDIDDVKDKAKKYDELSSFKTIIEEFKSEAKFREIIKAYFNKKYTQQN